jgi:alpha-glucuronidase
MRFLTDSEFPASFRLRALARVAVLFLIASSLVHAEDGYRLWLRYEPIGAAPMAAAYRAQLRAVRIHGVANTDAPGPVAAAPIAIRWGDPAACPDEFLLWFHHLPWDHPMRSGRTLWDELCLKYQAGVEEVRAFRQQWNSLEGHIDPERFAHVAALLDRQELNARNWRDACLLYFQTFSRRPLPAGVDAPAHPLSHYMKAQP